jgi:CheY-like chemotaxis protein
MLNTQKIIFFASGPEASSNEETDASFFDRDSVLKGKTILLIEDESLTRLQIKRFLHSKGCDILEAGDGLKGLSLFKSEKPDLILLDINLPRLNGLEVIEQIRAVDPDQNILVMTAYSEHSILDAIENYGVQAVISKPYSDQLLMEEISRFFR